MYRGLADEDFIYVIDQGNTIPFIARYRKEVTGNLDENQIREISLNYEYQQNLKERKESVINLIKEKGMLTAEISAAILACVKLSEVDAIYEPYKESRKTKGTEAIKMGLEPLAKKIMKPWNSRGNTSCTLLPSFRPVLPDRWLRSPGTS